MKCSHWVATLVATSSFFGSCFGAAPARADESCAGSLARPAVVACALRASPSLMEEERSLDAIEGRKRSADLVLPSNPVIGGTLGRSVFGGENDVDWSAQVSQEIAIGGQRGARLDVVHAEREAQERRIAAARRETAAAALAAYFDAIAAREEMRLADRVVALASALTVLAHARVDNGLASPVDADVADAAAARLLQSRFHAERRVAATSATLVTLVGGDPSRARIDVQGGAAPIAVPEGSSATLAASAVARRAEIGVAEAERREYEMRAELLRKSRIPNLTLSVLMQNDRANRGVLSVGLSLPIPLPAPIGHTHAGEIAEAHALAQRADVEAERLRRAVRLEVVTALDTLASRRSEARLFDPEKLTRAEAAIAAITRELEARRLSVRDALLAQQALVDLLQASVEVKLRLCLASVEAARAAGLPLEGIQ